MNKKIIPIKGMHCRSCELLIEDELSKLYGVTTVEVSQKKGEAIIMSNGHVAESAIIQAVNNAGYTIGKDIEKHWFSHNSQDYIDVIICGIILAMLFFVANDLGLFKLVLRTSSNYASLPVVFLVGLTAGLSTCMALVGGLVLGASARFAEIHPTATSLGKFIPHLFFSAGRIVSYFIFGGIIGYAGSFFQLSSTTLGLLTIIVGVVMLILGLQLVDLFPKLSTLRFTLPKGISKLLGIQEHAKKEYSHKNSFSLGALTFFLPCGFTQAMQLYAISSGSPVTGALTMGVFAIGTTPGLLGIGGLTSIIKGEGAKTFFKFAGIIVILLSFFNISNGYTLSGISTPQAFALFGNNSAQQNNNLTLLENGIQIVKMTQSGSGYEPNSFVVKKDIPVKWIITSTDVNTCASSIVSARLGVRKILQRGENIIEFTPTEEGKINFSCSMGMYTGSFLVLKNDGISKKNSVNTNSANTSCGANGKCGCGGRGVAAKPIVTAPPAVIITTVPIPAPTKNQEIQLIRAVYTREKDIQPNKFVVKAGIPVQFDIEVQEAGYGCMGSIFIPGLVERPYLLTQGTVVQFNFTPDKQGTYEITCAMGVPRGSIVVN